MSRYIDAEYDLHDLLYYYDFSDEDLVAIHCAMKGIPTADVVEVVRCKDCKFQKVEYGWNGKRYKVCINFDLPMDDEDFCSWGERRKDARNGNP